MATDPDPEKELCEFLDAIPKHIVWSSDAEAASFHRKRTQILHGILAKLNNHSQAPKRLLYFLDTKYDHLSLQIDRLSGRDRLVGRILQDACTSGGWYLFLCNVSRTSWVHTYYDFEEYDSDDEEAPMIVMDPIATCSGRVFATDVALNEMKNILGPDPYSERQADSDSEHEENCGQYGDEVCTVSESRYYDSAALLVPKDQLYQFFEFDIETNVLFDLVMDDLEAHPTNPAIRATIIGFLSKAIEKAPTTVPSVLTLAWRMKEDSLFHKAVHAGFKDGVPGIEAVSALSGIAKEAPEGLVDWDKSLRAFMSCHCNLTRLSESLNLFKSFLDPGMQITFQEWRFTMDLLNFEAKPLLDFEDHDAVLELATAQWGNAYWMNDTLIPKLRDCSDRKLLSKFICSLLQKDRENVLNKAKDTACILLQSSMPNLQLAGMPFNFISKYGDNWSECDRFCHLLSNCLQSGLRQTVDELLSLSLGSVQGVGMIHGLHAPMAEAMLHTMCKDFERNGMTQSEPARAFIVAILANFVLTDLPIRPQLLPGHSHRRRGCLKRCRDCEDLDAFLVSADERERDFLKEPKICEHLLSRLPSNLFQCRQFVADGRKPQWAIKVVKLGHEYQADMDQYNRDLRQVFPKVEGFRTDYMKTLLGDSAYDRYIMLEHLQSGNLGQKNVVESQVGSKRRAEDDFVLPVAKK